MADCTYGRTVPGVRAKLVSVSPPSSHARIKKEDGTWLRIPVEEGSEQGYCMSPISVAIVFGSILSKVEKELYSRTAQQQLLTKKLDGKKGGLPILMVYVDNVNCLLLL